MALNWATLTAFIGRVTAADSNYPYGSSKSETTSGAGDGTPYIKARADDIAGFQQAMLTEAGIVPSGSADTALNSQYLESLRVILNARTTTHNMASDADYTLTATQNKYNRFVITDTSVLLTTTKNIIIGASQKRFLVQNNTAQSLVFKTSGGTGITVVAGGKNDLYCDSTNVIEIGSTALDINGQTDKTTPIDTDNFILQEVGESFKKVSWANSKNTILTYMQSTNMSKIVQGTAVNSTSGTSIDFTGIPSWVKKITIMFDALSTSGTSYIRIQLGSSTIQNTGYRGTATRFSTSAVASANFTAGFDGYDSSSAGDLRNGQLIISKLTSNTWCISGSYGLSNSVGSCCISGSVSLAGVLDRIRTTTVNGTDTVDGGQINIIYEG